MFMKGYCDKDGFPREITWLSTLDAYTIISRFNAVLRGLANYYAEFVNYPSSLYRWLYIIRWSALKTLACKHHTTIRRIKEKYPNITTKVNVTLENGKKFYKQNRLITEQETIKAALSLNLKVPISKEQLEREKKGVLLYEAKNNKAKLLNSNFLEQITWVNMRTQVNLELPCLACGNLNNVEMHHIQHVRKGLFTLIDPQDTVKRMQFIRNRRQVPLCSSCHDKVHNGTYSGQPLKTLFRKQKNFDNRIAAPEGYIIKGEPYEGLPLEESLIEKG